MTDKMSVPFEQSIEQAEQALRHAATALQAEIRAYPTPISGCDAQYNHLIAERNRVLAAMGALNTPVFVATPRSPHAGAGVESR